MIAYDDDGKFSAYAWPGGYPIFEIMADGETLCVKCANSDAPVHTDAPNDDWRIISSEINWEDSELYCVHCGDRIESAYAEPED